MRGIWVLQRLDRALGKQQSHCRFLHDDLGTFGDLT